MRSLMDCFSGIEDPRRAEGLRTSLPQLLSMVTLSAMAGHTGYRPVANFCQVNAEVLQEALSLKHDVPSHVTFREVLQRLPHGKLIAAFHQWTSGFAIPPNEPVSGDGKALASTVKDSHNSEQNYQAVVSLFSQHQGLVLSVGGYQNAAKGKGEAYTLRSLLAQLKGKGLLITLDALHAQKNDR